MTVEHLGRTGWIEANLPRDPNGTPVVTPDDIDVVVRSFNVFDAEAHPERLDEATLRFRADWDLQLGIIGFQEAERRVRVGNTETSAAGHVANRFAQWFAPTDHDSQEELGLAWSTKEWHRRGATAVWMIGRRRLNLIRWEKSFMMPVTLIHRARGWKVSVYNTHLAPDKRGEPGSRRETRTRQIRTSLDIIERDVGAGELPPLFIGDMNFHPAEAENYALINERFRLGNEQALGSLGNGEPSTVGGDHIVVGRNSRFTHTLGSLVRLRWHTAGGSKEGIDLSGISDHPSPAMSFKVSGGQPHPDFQPASHTGSTTTPTPVGHETTTDHPSDGGTHTEHSP